MRRVLRVVPIVAFAAALGLSGMAQASSCPKHMASIDAALTAMPKITDEQMTEVKKLRSDGEEFHKAGKHAESMEALTAAEKILGIAGMDKK